MPFTVKPIDLLLLADLKAWLTIPANNTDPDNLLQGIITAVSTYFLNQCNRPAFLSASYTERFNGNSGYMVSPRYAFASSPILSVESVTVDGTAIPAAPSDAADGYIFDQYKIYTRGCYSFCKGVQNVAVSYHAGLSAIPDDLRQAAMETCGLAYRRRDNIGKTTIVMAGENITIDQKDVPAAARNTIKNYKRNY